MIRKAGQDRLRLEIADRGSSWLGGRVLSGGRELWAGLGMAAVVFVGLITWTSSSQELAAQSPRAEPRSPAPQLDLSWAQPVRAEENRAAAAAAELRERTELQAAAARAAAPQPSRSAYSSALSELLQRQALEQAQLARARDEERRRSPMVVLDRSPSDARARPSALREPDTLADFRTELEGRGQGGSEERLLRRAELESVETVSAQRLAHPDTTVPQGTLIRATLETSIQSDLPGMVRAQVRAPVYAFTGALVVPRGSTLIGRYESGLVQGQTRVFVVWTRLLRPDGLLMPLASPATDALGRSGISGKVDKKFFERFSGAMLLSLLDGGLAIAAARAQESDGSTIVNAGAGNLRTAAELALQSSIAIPPTIEIARGTPVQVFVARDLDFSEPVVRDVASRDF